MLQRRMIAALPLSLSCGLPASGPTIRRKPAAPAAGRTAPAEARRKAALVWKFDEGQDLLPDDDHHDRTRP